MILEISGTPALKIREYTEEKQHLLNNDLMPSNLSSTWPVAIHGISTTTLNKVGMVIISILQVGSWGPARESHRPSDTAG